jgi:hypothetical protein
MDTLEMVKKPTDGMRCTISPGRGDLPVGQFEAQNLLPNGSGTPSLASSRTRKVMNEYICMDNKENVNTLIHPGCGVCLPPNQLNKALRNTMAYDCDDVSQCAT